MGSHGDSHQGYNEVSVACVRYSARLMWHDSDQGRDKVSLACVRYSARSSEPVIGHKGNASHVDADERWDYTVTVIRVKRVTLMLARVQLNKSWGVKG